MATDGIPEEARLNGAGIAPLHPYAQWDKDHPQKAVKDIKWTAEDINLSELLGREAYNKNIKAPCQDSRLMSMLEGCKVGFAIAPMTAWTKGYNAEKQASL